LKPGSSLTLEALTSYLSTGSKLAAFKRPSVLFVWPEPQLPRGGTGKILKREIRTQVLKPRSKL
jgi:hypothetical protein